MSIANTPNLFHYATTELSQDAFLCWLASWAKPDWATVNEPLHKTGVRFLDQLLAVAGIDKPDRYEKVEVRKQYRKIDVLILINDRIALVIEDKTYTAEHSDQLRRYLDIARQDFPELRVAGIYLKTGDQSNYNAVLDAGFCRFKRLDFLTVLDYGAEVGAKNDILADYHRFLREWEEMVSSYADVSIVDWKENWNRWVGFFVALQERLGEGEWSYVPNQSGGFMGFWWHWRGNKYLQLEMENLCFKIEVKEQADQASSWHDWHATLMEASRGNEVLKLARPKRRRNGRWMTVAVLDDDYLKTDGRDCLDFDATVAVLKEAEHLLDRVSQ